jgi:hypothetical protein
MGELASRSSKAADYRRQAKEIRTLAAQISLMDARHQLLETARHLEALAGDEEPERPLPSLARITQNPPT